MIRAERWLALLLVAAGAVSAPRAHENRSDNAPPPKPIRIHAFGGLLGQVEGFCEYPGGEYDWSLANPALTPTGAQLTRCKEQAKDVRGARWIGGILGLSATLDRARRADADWVLVSPDNHPADSSADLFWSELQGLSPTAVSLGVQDFRRAARGTATTLADMMGRLLRPRNIPFLVSNAAIRLSEDNLNQVEFSRDGYDIHLDRHASVAWTHTFKVEHPSRQGVTADVQEFVRKPEHGDRGTAVAATFKPGSGGDGTVTLPLGLRPARWYRLVVSEDGAAKASVVFRSDEALTPFSDDGLADFPGRVKDGVLIVSLIDPAVRKIAASTVWTSEGGRTSKELVFVDPAGTLSLLHQRLSAAVEKATKQKRRPPIVLVSALEDDQTLALLAKQTDVRVVVLHPDSTLVTRASAQDKRTLKEGSPEKDVEVTFSGDLGFSAVADAGTPQAAKLFARPEWFGETLITISGRLEPSATAWTAHGLTAALDIVPGAELVVSESGRTVTYKARRGSGSPDLTVGAETSYLSCEKGASDDCRSFNELWAKPGVLVNFLGDALRRDVAADLSVVPFDVLDEDYYAWVSGVIQDGERSTGFISRYTLERLIYASPRIVKANVQGSDLRATLEKVVKQTDKPCIVGLTSACPTTLPADHPERLRVNGRAINPHVVYTLAMPDFLAEALSLDHDDEDYVTDLVEAADRHLRRFRETPWTGEGSLPQILGDAGERRWMGYWALSTADVTVSGVELADEDDTDVRRNLGGVFAGAKEHRTLGVNIDSDLALADYPRFAIRVPAMVKFNRRTENDETTYEGDEFMVGARLDWKLRWARLFGGYFIDGAFDEKSQGLKASREIPARDGYVATETAKAPTTYTVLPRRYRYAAAGIDLFEHNHPEEDLTLALRRIGLLLGYGDAINVPTALSIGSDTALEGTPLLDLLLSKGTQKTLNAYFAAHPDAFTQPTVLTRVVKTVAAYRVQGDVEGGMNLKKGGRTYTLDLKARYRYNETKGPTISPFELTRELRFEARASVPIWWRLKFTGTYEYERAKVEGIDGPDDPGGTNNAFSYQKFGISFSLPVMARFGRGGFIR